MTLTQGWLGESLRSLGRRAYTALFTSSVPGAATLVSSLCEKGVRNGALTARRRLYSSLGDAKSSLGGR